MAEEKRTTVNDKELEILEFWDRDKTFEKSLKKTKKSKPYIFYDGPPFATGLPHYGHILASVIKDAIPRYWTMNNRFVERRWGWDCHGLPVENIAEQELKIKTKDEIEKIGVRKFNNFCRGKVMTYSKEWGKTVKRIARWVDFDNSYKTMDNEYIESVWWGFKQLYDRGFIYEGEKILMYCPRCETPLSKSEVSMDNSYKTVKEDTITVKFKLADENVYALAWTTTPWTLPSNLALTINSNLEYSYVKDFSDGNTYLLAKKLIKNYFKNEKEYEIIKTVKGKQLANKRYEPLFPYFGKLKDSFKIIVSDFVTAEDGTGIVHTAPAFGEEDYKVCREHGIDFVSPIDEKGNFTEAVKDFCGMNIRLSNPKIIELLKKQGKIVKIEKLAHEYPFCYRCETPLIYRAIPAWFVNIQKIKSKLLKLNKKINWYPEFLKEGRMNNSIESAPDWNISRNRYWATAIPIWKSESGKIKVIGSIEELKKHAINLPKSHIDLHKDFLDEIMLRIDGEEYKRIPEVLDCWFESGSMPFAQVHYPFENKKEFEENFPSQFVAEYIGQTRAWFYYMMVLSAILFDNIPFENVLTTGTILAEDGSKMSKSKKNFPDPNLIIEKYGVDALRFYLLSTPVMNADNVNFSERGVEEIYKKVMVLLYNVNNFYSLYKNKSNPSDKSKEVIDVWIISRLNQLINSVSENLEGYNTIRSCVAIREFVDDLSTWYVRRNRDRFNEGDSNAVNTLNFVLIELAKVISPITPFISEIIWHNVVDEKGSVNLENWPKSTEKINEDVLKNMAIAREIVTLALRQRDVEKMPLKQPLAKITVSGEKLAQDYLDIIAEEVNVKRVEVKKSTELSVKLDTKLTPELEAEGYAREISRKVQALRKESGLVKEDVIKLAILVDEENKKMAKSMENMIRERTNSREILFEKINEKDYSNFLEDKIKDKKIKIFIRKI